MVVSIGILCNSELLIVQFFLSNSVCILPYSSKVVCIITSSSINVSSSNPKSISSISTSSKSAISILSFFKVKIPFLSNKNPKDPFVPRLPPYLLKIDLTEATVLLLLSVVASTNTAIPFEA